MKARKLLLAILFVVSIFNVFSKPINLKRPFVKRSEEFQTEHLFKDDYFIAYEKTSVALLEGDRLEVSAYDHGVKISRRMDITYKVVDEETGVVTYLALEGDCIFGSDGCSPRNISTTTALKDYRNAISSDERSHKIILDIYRGCYLGDSSLVSKRYRKEASFGEYPNIIKQDIQEVFNKVHLEQDSSSGSFLERKNVEVTLIGNFISVSWIEKDDYSEGIMFATFLEIEGKRVRDDGSDEYFATENFYNGEKILSVSVIDNKNVVPYKNYMFEVIIKEKVDEFVSKIHLIST